jgi:outer membrane receptor protein involved in Fe transport
MKKIILSFLAIVIVHATVLAQKGKITGKVISSKTGEALVGASVSIDYKNKATKADQNGVYTLSNLEQGSYNLTCTYINYTAKTMSVSLKEDEVIIVDIVMERAGDMSAVIVKGSSGIPKPKETVSSLLIAQKNSASVSDGISAETIKRTPDRNTGDILKRVSGASLQEDKFAVIRGLSDRYNAAYVNGAPLPSSESDRKAFAFDIFPANMLDNLIIYKTATPDMPGEFAGGQIVLNTKGIPAENFQSVTIGMGFNTATTFQNKKYADGGQWDFLGIDNTRRLPSNMPDIITFKNMSNAERIPYARSFQPNNWAILNKIAAPNTNFQYILGRNFQRKEKDFLGLIFAVTYQKTMTRNEGTRNFFAPEYDNAAQRVFTEDNHNTQTLFGAIGNLSLKINNNHSISFKNIYSINADDRVLTRDGVNDVINDPSIYFKSYALWFTSNKIYSGQLIGEHYLPSSKIKINWVASLSKIQRDIPALRRMAFDSTAGAPAYNAKLFDPNPVDNDNTAGLSFYSTNRENVNNFKFDVSRSFNFNKNFSSLFKVGGYYQMRDRQFNPRLLAFCNYNPSRFDNTLLTLAPDRLFINSNMGNIAGGKTGYNLKDITEIRDLYTAGTELYAFYAMTDQRIGKKLRMIYGARVEAFHQTLNAEFNQFSPVRVNTRKTDFLPSANLVYSLNTKQNLRLSYSKTINRPEFRELAPFLFRDYTIRYSIFGDTTLRRATIENFDFRYEFYPGKAQLISASAFVKKFTDPIELISVTNQDRTLSYRNTPSAQIVGAELEFRTLLGSLFQTAEGSLLNKLTLFGNFTYIQSKVNLKVTDTSNFYFKEGRVMQGQSPYVINAGITYQDEAKNISSTISLNRYGQRIFLASNGDKLQNGLIVEPNLWENGRTQIDFQFTKSFPKNNMDLKLNVKDVLAQQLVFFEDTNNNNKYDKGADALRSSQQFGRVISVSLSYKF